MNSDRIVLVLFATIKREEKSKGKRNEKRAVAAFKAKFYDVPKWFLDIKNANSLQDSKGIDVIVTTDIGDFFVQIKSSAVKADKFRQDQAKGRYSKNIAVVFIRESFTPKKVRQLIISAVYPMYIGKLQKISEEHGVKFIPAKT